MYYHCLSFYRWVKDKQNKKPDGQRICNLLASHGSKPRKSSPTVHVLKLIDKPITHQDFIYTEKLWRPHFNMLTLTALGRDEQYSSSLYKSASFELYYYYNLKIAQAI